MGTETRQCGTTPDIAGVIRRRKAAGEVISEHGAAAALISSEATLIWLGLPEVGAVYLVSEDGVVFALAPTSAAESDEDLRRALGAVLGDWGIPSCDHLEVDGAWARELAGSIAYDGSDALAIARQRKDHDEIELIRGAADLIALGHETLRHAMRAGVTETELWTAAKTTMERANGAAIVSSVDLMAGERTTLVGAPPTNAAVREGDPVLFDLAVRRAGYWADSCATLSCGSASKPLRERHGAIRTILDRTVKLARPGVRARDLDRAVRNGLHRAGLACPHHTGHGVGVAAQERPWLLPESEDVIDEGMVIAVEPGAYSDGFGVRLEHVLLIESDGASPLTTHSIELT